MRRTNHAIRALLAGFLLALSPALHATPAAGGLFEPDPGFIELGAALEAAPEPLPLPRLIEASLLASGIGPERLPVYKARLGALLDAIASSAEISASHDPAARGEALLAYLHKKTFVRYEVDATSLDLVLDSGKFNCLSSALLYTIAARGIGLEAYGVRTPDHAFCVLETPAKGLDVETTNRYGFDPGNKKEFKDSFGRVTGYAYAPPGAYAKREKVPDRAFAGLVLSNRAGILERSGRYREALRLGVDLAALAPGPESRAFLLDRVNNVAADLSRRRDYAGARAFAEAARSALGDSPRLSELARDAAQNEAAALAQAGRWDAALDAAAALAAAYPEAFGAAALKAATRKELGNLVESCVNNIASGRLRADDYAGARAALAARRGLLEATAGETAAAELERRIAEVELATTLERLSFAEALAEAEAARSAGIVSRERWEEALAYLYGKEANRLAEAGELLGAAAKADEGAARLAASKAAKLARYAVELRRAFAARAHNEFARLYNAGKYAAALEAADRALVLMPGDATLRADRRAASDAASREAPR